MIGVYRLMKPYCAPIVSKPRKMLASCMPSLMHNQFLGLLELLLPLKHKFSRFSHRNSWARTMNQRVEWGILFICYGWRDFFKNLLPWRCYCLWLKLNCSSFTTTLITFSFRNMSWVMRSLLLPWVSVKIFWALAKYQKFWSLFAKKVKRHWCGKGEVARS